MKSLGKALLAGVVLAGLVVQPAMAGPVAGLMESGEQKWNDDSFETAIRFNPNTQEYETVSGRLLDGDYIVGVANFESFGLDVGPRYDAGPGDITELTAFFATQIDGDPVLVPDGFGGFNFAINFKPVPEFESVYGAGAMVAFFDDVGIDFDQNAGFDPATFMSTTNPDTSLSAVGTSVNGEHLLTAGIDGAGTGWRSLTSTDDPTSVSQGTNIGAYDARLNVIDQSIPGVILRTRTGFGAGTSVDISLNGAIFASGSSTADLPISDDSNVFFDIVVPEPSSVICWGLMGVAALFVGRRRVRKG